MSNGNSLNDLFTESNQPTAKGITGNPQPVIKAEVVNRCVKVVWQFDESDSKFSMMEIIIDRNEESRMQGRVMVNPKNLCYFDLFPFPSIQSRWVYRAVFWSGIKRIGRWSEPAEVIVANQNLATARPVYSNALNV